MSTIDYNVFPLDANGSLITGCVDDRDCPYMSVCLANVSWTDPNIPPNTCACLNRYMGQGPQCDQMTPFSIFLSVSSAAMILFCLGLVGLIIYDLFMLFRYTDDSMSLGNSTSAVYIFSALSLLSIAVMKSYELYTFTYGVSHLVYEVKRSGPAIKYAPYADIQSYASCFIAMFGTLATLNVSLLWATVADESEKLRKRDNGQSINSRYRIFIIAVDVIYTILMFAITFSSASATMLVALVAALIIGLSYLFGYFRLRSVMLNSSRSKTSDGFHTELKNVLNRIFRSAITIAALCLLFVVFAVIYGLGQIKGGSKGSQKPSSKFNTMLFFWELAIWVLTIIIAVIVNFLHPNSHRLILKKIKEQELLTKDDTPSSPSFKMASRTPGSVSNDNDYSSSRVVAVAPSLPESSQ